MSEEYTHQLLRMVVAQICQPLGWQGMTTSSCEVLVDVLKKYMLTVARTTAAYSSHANRTEPNLIDLAQSFNDLGINLSEISEYCKRVESAKFNYAVPKFPLPKTSTHVHCPTGTSTHGTRVTRSSRSSSLSSEEGDYIPDYLPPLPSKKGAEKDDDAESGIQDTSDHEEAMETGDEARKTPSDSLKGLPQLFRSQRFSSDISEDGESSSRRNSISEGIPVRTTDAMLNRIPEAAVWKTSTSDGATVTQAVVPSNARGQGAQKNIFDAAFAKKLVDTQPRLLTQIPTARPEPHTPQHPKPPAMTKKPPPLRLMSPSTDTVPLYPIQQPPLSPLRSSPSPIRPTRPGLPILSPIQRPAVISTRPVRPVIHSRMTSPPMTHIEQAEVLSPTQTTPPFRVHPGMASPIRAHPPSSATTPMQPPQMPPMMSPPHSQFSTKSERPFPPLSHPLQQHPPLTQEHRIPMSYEKTGKQEIISPQSFSSPQELSARPLEPGGHQKTVKKETVSPQSFSPPHELPMPVGHQKMDTITPQSFSPPQELPAKPKGHQKSVKKEAVHLQSFSPPQELPAKSINHQKEGETKKGIHSPQEHFHLKENILQPSSSPSQELPTKPTGYQKEMETSHQQSFSPPHERSPTPIEEEEESPKSSSSESEGSPEIPLPPPNEFQLPTRKPQDTAMETTPTVQKEYLDDVAASEMQPSSPETPPTPAPWRIPKPPESPPIPALLEPPESPPTPASGAMPESPPTPASGAMPESPPTPGSGAMPESPPTPGSGTLPESPPTPASGTLPESPPTPASGAMLEPPALETPLPPRGDSPLLEEEASSPVIPDIEQIKAKFPEIDSSDVSDDSEDSDSDIESEIPVSRISPERPLTEEEAPEGMSLVIRLQKHLFTSRRKQLEKLAKVVTKEVESPSVSVFTSGSTKLFSGADLKGTSIPTSVENTPSAPMVVSFNRKLLRYSKYGILPSPSEVKTTKTTGAERVKLRLASFGERRVIKPSPTSEESPSLVVRKRELDLSEMGMAMGPTTKKAKMETTLHPVKVIPQPSSSSSSSSSSEDESESCTPSPYPTPPPPPPTTFRSPWQQPMGLEEDEDSTPSSHSESGGGLKLKLKISKALLHSAGVNVSSAKPSRKEKMKAAAAISQRSKPSKSGSQQKSKGARSRGSTALQQKTGVIISSFMPAPPPIIVPPVVVPEVYICPQCNRPDDGSPMICCDSCESWLHVTWLCSGISQVPPEDETWYCPTCVRKSKKKSKKRKRYPA